MHELIASPFIDEYPVPRRQPARETSDQSRFDRLAQQNAHEVDQMMSAELEGHIRRAVVWSSKPPDSRRGVRPVHSP